MADLSIYARQNFGNRVGFGERPALLIVDFVEGFTDPAKFGGFNIPDAIRQTERLLAAARAAGLPVAHTRVVYQEDGAELGAFARKVPSLATLTEDAPESRIVPSLTPRPGEYVVKKLHASAFFGTGLAPWLIAKGVDTLLVTGCTTSGCVRASVIDSCAYNFRTIVPRECSGDRAEAPHEANLFDMDQKYADVMPLDAVLERIRPAEAA